MMLGQLIGYPEPEINIGFAPNMRADLIYGKAWLHVPGKERTEYKPFTVDRPKLLDDPKASTIKQIFTQIAKLGFGPDRIELIVGNEYRVYEYGTRGPVIKQRKL